MQQPNNEVKGAEKHLGVGVEGSCRVGDNSLGSLFDCIYRSYI